MWCSLHLCEDGAERDAWKSGPHPFAGESARAEARERARRHRRSPVVWQPYLAAGAGPAELGRVFHSEESWRSGEFAATFAGPFGWPGDLAELGCPWNPEGVPVSDWQHATRCPVVSGARPGLEEFVELHFARPGRLGRGEGDEPFWPEA